MNEDQALIDLTMLLWVDRQYQSEHSVPGCFGDRYLYANNAPFAAVRNAFLSFGFSYSSQSTRLWQDYYAAPLCSLDRMLQAGVVPYLDNAAVIEQIISRRPGLKIPGRSLLSVVRGNYLLHESAHLIADRLLPPLAGSFDQEYRMALVARALLCESFANAIERVAAAYAHTGTHILLFNLNSYVHLTDETRALLRTIIELFGMTAVLQLGILAHFHTNTHDTPLPEVLSEAFLSQVLPGRNLSKAERELLKLSIRRIFTITRAFRDDTSALFFALAGCESEYLQFSRDPLDLAGLSRFDILNRSASLVSAIESAVAPSVANVEQAVEEPA
jgi:hypothetical protein